MISRNNFRGSVNYKTPPTKVRSTRAHGPGIHITMASFIVEAMVVRGIHELIRGHNFRVLIEIRENLEN